MRIIDDLSVIGEGAWDALVVTSCGSLHPLSRYAFLQGLHTTGCASAATGWEPQFLTLWDGDTLIGAIPLYRKHHSYGEYVFDWAWADAFRRHGLDYYPKWLVAIPFTPVSAPKLLARDDTTRVRLESALVDHARNSALSSLHVLFPNQAEADLLEAAQLLVRRGVQFHWRNANYQRFDDFLASLTSAKRKKIRAERRKVLEAGVSLRSLTGAQISDADWQFFFDCYVNTYRLHASTPYLNLAFFRQLGATMSEQVLLIIADRDGQPIAATLSLFDEHTLYGRYWGALESVPYLHFEACYYTPIEFCIARGIAVFEGGAQGEHKLARGFLPAEIRSAHWIAQPAFATAIERFVRYESVGIDGYLDELNERSPFKIETQISSTDGCEARE